VADTYLMRFEEASLELSFIKLVPATDFPLRAVGIMNRNGSENWRGPDIQASGPRILIIEDEAPMRTVLRDILDSEGFRVLTADDGEQGLERAIREKPDLILLDIMLPKLDGFALCAELRSLAVEPPVLMLTAKGQVEDRVSGLDSGADDYLVKPFSSAELLARVRALLRRSRRPYRLAKACHLGEVHIDFVKQTARRGRATIHLTSREFAMLRLLVEAGGEPVTRDRFLDVVWGYTAFPTTRTVDNHIASLRAKLERNPENPKWIKTVHGVGYRLDIEDASGTTKSEFAKL
jgi:DNA-binding response OmpR family regulator